MYKKLNIIILFFLKYLLIILLSVIVIESLTRVSLFLILKDRNIFGYGFNSDLEIHTLDLSKFEISIFDRNNLNLKDEIKPKKKSKNQNKNNKIVIWTFGGSTTMGYNCGKDSSSWPNELETLNKKFIVKNFAQDGYSTDKSIPLLWKSLRDQTPDIVIWAHKWNISQALYGAARNKEFLNYDTENINKNEFFFNVKRFDKSFKKSFLFYYFFDQIILRINIKLNLLSPPGRIKDESGMNVGISNTNWDMAVKNFEINTTEAIELSKQKKVKEFYIVSLFLEKDVPEKSKDYFNDLYDKTVYNLEGSTLAKVIDLTKNVNRVNKNNFFCDGVHQTIIGNKYISNEINKFLINNTEIFK